MMRVNRVRKQAGTTLVEILFALVILGIIIFPILQLVRTGVKGTKKAKDDLISSMLAREKLEQLRVLPFKDIQGDFVLYGSIFEDTFVEDFIAMDENPVLFRKNFSDVMTLAFAELYPDIYSRFTRIFTNLYGREYLPYATGYDRFRRLTEVDERVDDVNYPSRLKRITVKVFIRGEDKPMVELVTYRANY